jgi:HSP20 family molecular chaperone IbpA
MNSLFNVGRPADVRQEAVPRVELVEYETSYSVKADIQEAGLDGVAIWIEAGILTITSEDHTGSTDGAVMLPRLNSFRFTLALPDDAEETALSVECEGRVLHLNFGRRAP